jgi:hypothetical protein
VIAGQGNMAQEEVGFPVLRGHKLLNIPKPDSKPQSPLWSKLLRPGDRLFIPYSLVFSN